jgi:hypothetical protein
MPDDVKDLDAQVARRLGWKQTVIPFNGSTLEGWELPDGHFTQGTDSWSTDIRAAMELVKDLHVCLFNDKYCADVWTCIIYTDGDSPLALGNTPAEAICNAFLSLPPMLEEKM